MATKDLVDRLIELRHQAGLSQAALATKLDITAASIGFYETRRRRVPVEMVHRWVEACGAEFHEVFLRPGELLEATLAPEERALLLEYRRLKEPDQELVRDLTRGLNGGSPLLREAIAAQVPLLLKSVPSEAPETILLAAESSREYKTSQ